MVIGTPVFIIAIVVIGIWIIIEMKRFKHKILAVVLIGLILFFYLSFTTVMAGKDIDFKTIDGLQEAGKIYLNWFVSAFTNVKSITANAVKMDWSSGANNSIG